MLYKMCRVADIETAEGAKEGGGGRVTMNLVRSPALNTSGRLARLAPCGPSLTRTA